MALSYSRLLQTWPFPRPRAQQPVLTEWMAEAFSAGIGVGMKNSLAVEDGYTTGQSFVSQTRKPFGMNSSTLGQIWIRCLTGLQRPTLNIRESVYNVE